VYDIVNFYINCIHLWNIVFVLQVQAIALSQGGQGKNFLVGNFSSRNANYGPNNVFWVRSKFSTPIIFLCRKFAN